MKTADAFKIFKAEASRCIDKAGLKNWDIEVEFRPVENGKAECPNDCINRYASIVMGSNHDWETVGELKRAARHEVGHIIAAELAFLARARFATLREIERATESMCTLFEKLL